MMSKSKLFQFSDLSWWTYPMENWVAMKSVEAENWVAENWVAMKSVEAGELAEEKNPASNQSVISGFVAAVAKGVAEEDLIF